MVVAEFKGNETTKYVGDVYQYDLGQVLCIKGLNLPKFVEIDFALQETGSTTESEVGITRNGVTEVEIPNHMLINNDTNANYMIYAFVYLTDETSGETIRKIRISVKARSKPENFTAPEDTKLFQEAIKVVNESAERAESAEQQSAQHAEQTKLDAQQTTADRQEVEKLVESVSGISEQVQAVKDYKEQAQTAATNALLSEQKSNEAKEAALQAQARAEASEGKAEQHALEVAGDKSEVERLAAQVRQDKTAVDDAQKLIKESEITVNEAKDTVERKANEFGQTVQDVKTQINNAGKEQIKAVEEVLNMDAELTEYYTVAKRNIKEAIVNKGVHIGEDVSLNGYAEKIGEIPSAVVPTEDLPEQTVITGYGLQETVGIKLSWRNVNAAGYLVKRKLGGVPLSTADGDTVCDIADTTYTDTGVQKGLEYYYRIFPYNTKRQFQAELGASTVRVEYKSRENQVRVQDLKVGDMLKFGRYGTSDYFWKVCDTLTKDKGYISVAAEQNLGNLQWDAPENAKDNPNPITNRKNQGSNRYAFSNVRQLLNTDKEKGTWYVKQHDYDVSPSYATSYNGFLHDFTDYEKEIIYARSIACVLDEADGGGLETVEDKIWLPASYEMGLEIRTAESDHVFDGFPNAESIKYQSNYWLRTMNGSASSVRFVFSSGALYSNVANGSYAVRPFCSLPTSAYLRWSDSDKAYVFADDSTRNPM